MNTRKLCSGILSAALPPLLFIIVLSPSEVDYTIQIILCALSFFWIFAEIIYLIVRKPPIDIWVLYRTTLLGMVVFSVVSGFGQFSYPYIEALWNLARLSRYGAGERAESGQKVILYSKDWGGGMSGNFCMTVLLSAADFTEQEAGVYLYRKYFEGTPENLEIARPTSIKIGSHYFSYVGCG